MAVYTPTVNVPPWVRERIETQGLTGCASVFRAEQTAASGASDTVSATAFGLWTAAIESARQYPGTASGRATFMVIRKA